MRGGSPIYNFSFLSKYKLIISILILFLCISTVSAANNATVTSDTIPSVMRAGQSYSVSITMKNDGTTIWNETYLYRLGTDGAGDAYKFTTPIGRWIITGSVNPGSSYTFPITMTAPLVNGSGSPVFRMVRDGVEWFGENRTHPVSVSPAGSFTSNVTGGRVPSVGVLFNDTSTNTPTAWAWFFGDESYNQSWTQQNYAGPMNMWNNYVALPNGIIVEMGGVYGTFYRKEVWISTDQGANWWGDYTPSWSGRALMSSVALSDGSIVLMGGTPDGSSQLNDVWRSTDGGYTWTQQNASAGWSARSNQASVVLSDDSIILMGGYNAGIGALGDVWRSTDSGITWTRQNASIGYTFQYALAGVLTDGDILLTDGYYVYTSSDKGVTWTLRNSNTGGQARFNPCGVAMPDNSFLMFAGSTGGFPTDVWRTTDKGVTWTQVIASSGWSGRFCGQSAVALPDGSVLLGASSGTAWYRDTWRFQPVGSTSKNTTHLYTSTILKKFNVSLQTSNAGGYNNTYKSQYIGVYNQTITGFTSNTTTGVIPQGIIFNVTVPRDNATMWNWSFGDGAWQNGTSQNVSYTYLNSGVYTVNETASNGGATNTTTRSNYITIYNSTVSGFIANITSGVPSLNVSFNVTIPRDNATQWNWSFGDGAWQNGTTQNATHTYTSVGYYIVTLNASSLYATSTTTRINYIIVYTNMIVDFSSNITSGFPPVSVLFNDLSVGAIGWSWFFGDESYNQSWNQINASSGWLPRYLHSSVVLQDGSIVMTGGSNGTRMNDTWRSTNNGATWVQQNVSSGWSIRQSHSSVTMPDTSIILMGGYNPISGYLNDTWRSIDNGATWTLMNASSGWSARFGFTSVALSDGSIVIMGGSSSTTDKNDVWRSTNNGATWTLMNASSGWSVRTELTSVAMLDNSIIIMGGRVAGNFYNDVWRSTDYGVTWVQQTPAAWNQRARFSSVRMPDNSIIIMGGFGSSIYNDVWRSVDGGVTWTRINASAGWSPRSGQTSVLIPNSSIIVMGGTDGDFFNDTWSFNPSGSSLQNPTHTYISSGYFNVALQSFSSSRYGSILKTGYISIAGPLANFNITPNPAQLGTSIVFVDMSSNGPTLWNWSFGDGSISTSQNTTHTYSSIGEFTVRLNVSNIYGFSNVSHNITIYPSTPIANFTIDHNIGTNPLTVQFTDTTTGSGITDWYWNFGDGTTSTTPSSVSHQYTSLGTYYSQLTVTSSVGTNVSQPQAIYVVNSAVPIADFTGAPVFGSAPLSVQFTDLSIALSGVNAWNWSFGDGNYSNSQNPVHIYSSFGQYSVTLTATSGAFSNYTTKLGYINIGISSNTVLADFVAIPLYAASYPQVVQFTDTSVCSPVCTNWAWDFNGDGSTDSVAQNPSYNYTYPGNYSPKLIVSNGLNTGTKIRNQYIVIGPIFVAPTITQPTEIWRPGYHNNTTSFSFKGNTYIDVQNSTYLKYWLQNFTATGNFSVYGFAIGMMAPIMHVFGFWIFLIVWGLYLFAVWIRSQDVTLPLIIGILTMGTFGLLFPQESLPVIIIMFVICGAIIITKLMKDSI